MENNMNQIKVGDKFKVKIHPDYLFERIEDDPAPAFECETMRVKVIYPAYLKLNKSESIFPVELEWFKQRGLTPRP